MEAGDRLVYGHTHRPAGSDDGLAANPGAWVGDGGESGTYLVLEDGAVTLRRFGRDPFP
jgi:predicted phosphodiesterase